MAGWYPVVKIIMGHKYLYAQQTYREGGRVRTRNRYLGRADGGGGAATTAQGNRPGSPPPLFAGIGDFGSALASQFDAACWGVDAQQQLLGAGGTKKGTRPRSHSKVTTTKSKSPDTRETWHI